MFCRIKKYPKKEGFHKYYYLVESKREGTKVKQKNIEYIGEDLKECLEARKEELSKRN